jgi:hypothetical protein
VCEVGSGFQLEEGDTWLDITEDCWGEGWGIRVAW